MKYSRALEDYSSGTIESTEWSKSLKDRISNDNLKQLELRSKALFDKEINMNDNNNSDDDDECLLFWQCGGKKKKKKRVLVFSLTKMILGFARSLAIIDARADELREKFKNQAELRISAA
jgi:hypothetical protein